jgi:FAD/FMN-containing dehydrogenase
MASMGVLGVLNSIRSTPLLAKEHKPSLSKAVDKVITKNDDNYEIWRQSMHWHQSKPDRYPDMIVQAQSVDDVIAAVKHAAANKLKIALKSGGHNAAGSPMRNSGMLLDVAALNSVEIDSEKQIASIQPGVKSIQLVSEAGKQGLTFPAPHCPSVGLSGFTMGGGIGWNYSAHGGMSCYSIDSAEVVLANGKLVTASAKQNSELLWAIRGGGQGFFGAVTRLNLKLYPAPRAIHASNYILPLDELELVTRSLDELAEKTDDRVELLVILTHNPAAPAKQAKICLVTAFCFADTTDEALELLKPVAQSALADKSIVKEENQPFSFEGLYNKYFSLEVPAGMLARYKVDNVMTNEPAKVLHALKDHFKRAPSPHTHVLAGYGMNLQAKDDVCSIASTYLGCYAIWDREEDDEANLQWLGDAIPLMDPFAEGHYVNEVEPSLNPDRMRQCYTDETWMRLEQLRAKYDPDGVFHHFLGQG